MSSAEREIKRQRLNNITQPSNDPIYTIPSHNITINLQTTDITSRKTEISSNTDIPSSTSSSTSIVITATAMEHDDESNDDMTVNRGSGNETRPVRTVTLSDLTAPLDADADIDDNGGSSNSSAAVGTSSTAGIATYRVEEENENKAPLPFDERPYTKRMDVYLENPLCYRFEQDMITKPFGTTQVRMKACYLTVTNLYSIVLIT